MKDILNSHSVATLKKEISKTNIKGYSKLNKAQVVELMLKNKDRFKHIKMNTKGKKEKERKEIYPTSTYSLGIGLNKKYAVHKGKIYKYS